MIRLQHQYLVEDLDRFIVPGGHQARQQAMRKGNLWIKPQRLLEDLDSFVSAFRVCVGVSEQL